MKIADVRSRIEISPYKGDTGKKNAYWEGFLCEEDSRYIGGFDWAADEVEASLLDIEAFERAVEDSGLQGFDTDKLDQAQILEEKTLDEYTPEERKKMSHETRFVKALFEEIGGRLEMFRNMTVISMIENTSDAQYESIVQRAEKGEFKNYLVRKQEDEASTVKGEE